MEVDYVRQLIDVLFFTSVISNLIFSGKYTFQKILSVHQRILSMDRR